MAARPGLAGLAWAGRGGSAGFATPMANAAGNNLPGITGAIDRPVGPAPGPYTGGQLGGTGDGQNGADPRADQMQPYPTSRKWMAWGQGQQGEDGSQGHQSFRRYGTQGFNDKLTVKDRHAYWDTGNQKTGLTGGSGGGLPNTYNNPMVEPPRPDLRLVNRTVSYQLGTDTTRNQDDLTRAYTWLGEQGSGWSPVYGGVPGLYQPYGSRGGIPYPIVSPAEQGQPGDGNKTVWSGPPHGLHSTTPWKGGAQIIARFSVTPQTRPVRQDRPSNSPQAGQSYSQTVLPQGASRVRPAGGRPGRTGTASRGGLIYGSGRGWAGRKYTGGQGAA
jgi:hypothetical protein